MDEGQNTSLPLIACSVCIFFLIPPALSFNEQFICKVAVSGFIDARLLFHMTKKSIQMTFFFAGIIAMILNLLISCFTLSWQAVSVTGGQEKSGFNHSLKF